MMAKSLESALQTEAPRSFCQTRQSRRQHPFHFFARVLARGFREQPAALAEPTHEGISEEACWVSMWCIVHGECRWGAWVVFLIPPADMCTTL